MIDHCVQICANAAGECMKLKKVIISDIKLINNLVRLIKEGENSSLTFFKELTENILWCCSNLAN